MSEKEKDYGWFFDVKNLFIELPEGPARPLLVLGGVVSHLVRTGSEVNIDSIQQELQKLKAQLSDPGTKIKGGLLDGTIEALAMLDPAAGRYQP